MIADIQDTLFREFRIESNNQNEIWIELHLDALLKILRSAESCGASMISAERFFALGQSRSDKLIKVLGTGMGDSKSATALEAATSAVTLKLNKRGKQAIWAFDIKGVVSWSFTSHHPGPD